MVRESFDIHFIIEKFPAILSALPVTLEITAVTLVLGWLLGLLVAWGKVSGSGWLKKFLGILTDIIRGIPTVVLLYIVYFGLPKLINVSNWSKISFVVLALMIELGTTSSEMFRSAYNSIQKGQLEAAHALGYTEIISSFPRDWLSSSRIWEARCSRLFRRQLLYTRWESSIFLEKQDSWTPMSAM